MHGIHPVVISILMGMFLFFVREDMAGKFAACMVCPAMIIYLIYAYKKEKKADHKAVEDRVQFMDGSYFESPKWHEQYLFYRNEHPFQRPECRTVMRI